MHPDQEEENISPVTPDEMMRWTKQFYSKIADLIDDCGAYADICSSIGEGSGTHGLQMCYDKLTEAKMWAEQSVNELAHEKVIHSRNNPD